MNAAGSTTRAGRRRRRRVVKLYRQGLDVPEIARRMRLTRKTVNHHLAAAGVPRVLDAERTPRLWPERRAPYWELRRRDGGAGEVVLGRKFCPGCGRWRHVVDFPTVGGVPLSVRDVREPRASARGAGRVARAPSATARIPAHL